MLRQCLESVFSVLEIKLLFVGLEMRLGSRGGFWNRLNHAAYFVNRTISTEEKALGLFETIVVSLLAAELGVVIFLPSFQRE